MGKILIIGIGDSTSNVIENLANENIPDVNYLKIHSGYSGTEPSENNITTIDLYPEQGDLVSCWSPIALKELAEEKEEEIREAIIRELK